MEFEAECDADRRRLNRTRVLVARMREYHLKFMACLQTAVFWQTTREIPMRGLRITALTLAFGLGLAGAVQAQTVGYNIRTGDVWVDNRLGEINDYGNRYRDPFINELNAYYGAPRPLLRELLDERRWAPADVYYACSIARALRVPCADIVREYDRNPGQGWGVIAQRRGIKPGSRAFHAMKHGTMHTYDRWGQPVTLDHKVRVDWSRHGPQRGKGPGQQATPARATRADAAPRGNPGQGKDSNKGKDPGKGKGNNGNGKGKDG